jgi:aminopeptidase N
VYEKGAEVIRLYATVLGTDGFRRGTDLYFARHDGQAVTCDDFWQAMHDANADHPGVTGGDLAALKTWYSQAGTPELAIETAYDASARTLTLKASQHTPATPGQAAKQPVLIPIAVGLLGPDGKDLPLALEGTALPAGATTAVLRLTKAADAWTFTGVPAGVVPSILRNFSAPVRLSVAGQSDADLAFLFAHDSDPFNRWEAGQRLSRTALLSLYDACLPAVAKAGPEADVGALVGGAIEAAGGVPSSLSAAFAALLADGSLDGAFVARAISLPAESELVDALAASSAHKLADPLVVHHVREHVVRHLSASLKAQLQAAVASADAAIAAASGKGYSPDFASVARRALRNKALVYLSTLGDAAVITDIAARHARADNMTDSMATLAALVEQPVECKARAEALAGFYGRWKSEPLVLLKWLGVQAGSSNPANVAVVRALMEHPAFSITNPNACYSLFGGFTAGSVPAFHAADGSGYAFLGSVVRQLDAVNPQVAARIVGAFARYRSYDARRQALMRRELEALAAGSLSENVGEIVTRSLAA